LPVVGKSKKGQYSARKAHAGPSGDFPQKSIHISI
jgi:hypothetical protein